MAQGIRQAITAGSTRDALRNFEKILSRIQTDLKTDYWDVFLENPIPDCSTMRLLQEMRDFMECITKHHLPSDAFYAQKCLGFIHECDSVCKLMEKIKSSDHPGILRGDIIAKVGYLSGVLSKVLGFNPKIREKLEPCQYNQVGKMVNQHWPKHRGSGSQMGDS